MQKRFKKSLAYALLVFTLLVLSTNIVSASTIGGAGQIRYGVSQRRGFDTCAAPSESSMSTWWTYSPYWDIGIYIGGANRGCSQPNLTTTWLTNVHNQGWSYYLTWVGPQVPARCTARTFSSYMTYDVTTAYNEGKAEADKAVTAAYNLGFTGLNIYFYDLEAYTADLSSDQTQCRNVAKSFINGWVDRIHNYYGEKAGVYGATCGSYVSDWAGIANPPNTVWLANWNNSPSVWAVSCVSSSLWVNSQRLHQYAGNSTETYGSVTINIDANCADGNVTPHGHGSTDTACTALAAPVTSTGDMKLVSSTEGWAHTGQGLTWTSDGGKTWRMITPPQVAADAIRDTRFISGTTGWTATLDASDDQVLLTVYRTTDTGATWTVSTTPVSNLAAGPVYLDFVDSQHGWAVVKETSSSNFSFGELYSTADGGATWTKRSIPVGEPVKFANATTGWTARGESLYTTHDGGATWELQAVTAPAGLGSQPAAYYLPTFASATAGTLPVAFAGGTAFYTTRDGGQRWQLSGVDHGVGDTSSPAPIAVADGTWFVARPGSLQVAAAGVAGSPMRIDGVNLTNSDIIKLDFASATTGWAMVQSSSCASLKTSCTTYRYLVKTTDGGQSWSLITPRTISATPLQ